MTKLVLLLGFMTQTIYAAQGVEYSYDEFVDSPAGFERCEGKVVRTAFKSIERGVIVPYFNGDRLEALYYPHNEEILKIDNINFSFSGSPLYGALETVIKIQKVYANDSRSKRLVGTQISFCQ